MEKYFYKTTSDGKCLKRCEFRDDATMIGSITCNHCKFNRGYDNFYNWIRCKFYSVYAENYNLYKKIKTLQEEIIKLKNGGI